MKKKHTLYCRSLSYMCVFLGIIILGSIILFTTKTLSSLFNSGCRIIATGLGQRSVSSYRSQKKGPGKLGPITLPAHDDILVLDAMARLLREELEPIFLRESKGFRVAREARTFFKDVSAWPQMDFLVQSSVHNCHDTISHELLVNELYEVLGKENLDFIVLQVSFLGAPPS